MEETTQEPTYRLNRKTNFKGEKATEYTVRANTIEELKLKDQEMKELLKED